jgi:hypothetical protein
VSHTFWNMAASLGSKCSSFVAIRADEANKQPRYLRLSTQRFSCRCLQFRTISSTFSTVSRCVLRILILSIKHSAALNCAREDCWRQHTEQRIFPR